MTTTETKDQRVVNTAEILLVVQDIWEDIRQVHPDTPDAVFAFGSGARGKRMVHGHFHAHQWQRAKEKVHEVFIAGEGLQRGAVDTLGTLLHEAAHGIAHTREIQETSRQGRYHNDKFREIGEELGLVLEKDPKIGWSPTTVPEATQFEWQAQIEALADVLSVYRLIPPPKPPKASNNLPVLECGCGRKMRMSKAVRELGPVTCGVCEEEFKDPEQ